MPPVATDLPTPRAVCSVTRRFGRYQSNLSRKIVRRFSDREIGSNAFRTADILFLPRKQFLEGRNQRIRSVKGQKAIRGLRMDG